MIFKVIASNLGQHINGFILSTNFTENQVQSSLFGGGKRYSVRRERLRSNDLHLDQLEYFKNVLISIVFL